MASCRCVHAGRYGLGGSFYDVISACAAHGRAGTPTRRRRRFTYDYFYAPFAGARSGVRRNDASRWITNDVVKKSRRRAGQRRVFTGRGKRIWTVIRWAARTRRAPLTDGGGVDGRRVDVFFLKKKIRRRHPERKRGVVAAPDRRRSGSVRTARVVRWWRPGLRTPYAIPKGTGVGGGRPVRKSRNSERNFDRYFAFSPIEGKARSKARSVVV